MVLNWGGAGEPQGNRARVCPLRGRRCHHGDHDDERVRVGDGTGQRTGSGADGSVVIRAIAAIDDKLGLSTDTGIPWHVQADIDYFRATTRSANVLMGSATYREFKAPMPDRD